MIDPQEVFIVQENMQRYGGSFAKALGVALAHADFINQMKIAATWSDLWKHYRDDFRK